MRRKDMPAPDLAALDTDYEPIYLGGYSVMAANQHDEAVNAASTRLALVAALDHWEKAGCDCCSPTVADDAIDAIGYDVAYWERMRRFAIELAQTAQNVIDQESGYRS